MLNKSIIASMLSLTFATHAIAESYTGKVYCEEELATETVVVYVNGIQNSVVDAEDSRKALKNVLSSAQVCTAEATEVEGPCVVQKFYNADNGFFGDTNELRAVAKLERNAANVALINTVAKVQSDFIAAHGILSTDEERNLFQTLSAGTLEALRFVTDSAYDALTLYEVDYPFKEWGNNVSGYLIENIKNHLDTSNIEESSYQNFILQYKDRYNGIFFEDYYKLLKSGYMEDRAFYGDNDKAMKAVTKSVEGLTSYAVELVKSGKKVVLVPHSQGNHVVELSHSLLRSILSTDELAAIKVMGAASVAASSPDDTYISWDEDHTVMNIHDYTSASQPSVGNFINGTGNSWRDLQDHNFNSVYLSNSLIGNYVPQLNANVSMIQDMLATGNKYSMRQWLVGLIDSSIEAAVAVPQELEADGFITTTLRWELWDDMDLHTIEPTGEHVYYSNKWGSYGELDYDDRDGSGPEHYTVTATCEDVENKSWDFGIHQYPSGGSQEVAHLSVKIANQFNNTHSYSNPAWPYDTVYLSKLTFGAISTDTNGTEETSDDRKVIEYTLVMDDSL